MSGAPPMRRALTALTAAFALLALAAAPASAEFGLGQFEFNFTANEDGAPETQAGAHPFAVESFFEVNYHPIGPDEYLPDGGDIKDLVIEQVRGLTGDTTAVARCTTLQFVTDADPKDNIPDCPDSTAVGATATHLTNPVEMSGASRFIAPIYNLTPPPGVPVRIGFIVADVPVVIDVAIKPSPDHNAIARLPNIPQPLTFFAAATQLWGVPADDAHDFLRGTCAQFAFPDPFEPIVDGRLNVRDPADAPDSEKCKAGVEPAPWLTLPRACGALATSWEASPWADPSHRVFGAELAPPFSGCSAARVGFEPEISSQVSTDRAATGSGQDFELSFEDPVDGIEGLTEPDGIAASDMKRIEVALPEGMTANPSLAEGLGTCSPADLGRETLAAQPGEGCPNSSKIGSIEVQTPIVAETLHGSVYVAKPDDPRTSAPGAENPFDSLIALYVVLKDKGVGLLVKQAGEVAPDPETGQLITTFDDVAQQPFTRLSFRFREGTRPPLITPPECGTHTTTAKIVPWARPGEELTRTASFRLERGPGGGPCPPGGAPPFAPGFAAGTLNNAAAHYSPFAMRLTRQDGHQDITRFDAVLPPGVVARLAGVGRCPESAIALAKQKSGKEERAAPSCPAAARIGSVLSAAGVGSALTYVPGRLYLAGPLGTAPLSVVAIVPAVAGPFDVGTVVVRQALELDPVTGVARVNGALSDPIPHILAGIPLAVREIRVAVDRPAFTLNPTSCRPLATQAGIWGGGADPFSRSDDAPVPLAARFQAADCAALGFEPRLAIKLRGGTGRGAHPALRAIVTPRPGDANFSRAVVKLPRSAFLDQAHIRTICTRVQFAAGPGHGALCPKGARYGFARAWSPLLDGPATGPVYLRSSNNNLPDLVVALTGPPSAPVQVEISARIDSVRGGIRSTFAAIPDVPVSRFILDMQGAKKGLIVNSRNLCHRPGRNRADARLRGQNGRISRTKPIVRAVKCAKRKRRKAKRASVSRAYIADRIGSSRR